jgi:hypothetical protein
MGFFSKRSGPEDFYSHISKAMNIPMHVAPQHPVIRDAERKWRVEFDAYGMPADEYVRAWFTMPRVPPLAEAWKAQMALFEEVSGSTFQMILTKLSDHMNNTKAVSATVPPTFVILAWRDAGCPDPVEWVKTDGALFGPW